MGMRVLLALDNLDCRTANCGNYRTSGLINSFSRAMNFVNSGTFCWFEVTSSNILSHMESRSCCLCEKANTEFCR